MDGWMGNNMYRYRNLDIAACRPLTAWNAEKKLGREVEDRLSLLVQTGAEVAGAEKTL